MLEIGALEAENSLGSLLDRVQGGEEIVITRRGQPVARLIPNFASIDRVQARAAAERIRTRALTLKDHSFTWKDLRKDRDQGRP